jgi:hypothetical protein
MLLHQMARYLMDDMMGYVSCFGWGVVIDQCLWFGTFCKVGLCVFLVLLRVFAQWLEGLDFVDTCSVLDLCIFIASLCSRYSSFISHIGHV